MVPNSRPANAKRFSNTDEVIHPARLAVQGAAVREGNVICTSRARRYLGVVLGELIGGSSILGTYAITHGSNKRRAPELGIDGLEGNAQERTRVASALGTGINSTGNGDGKRGLDAIAAIIVDVVLNPGQGGVVLKDQGCTGRKGVIGVIRTR